VLRFGPTPGGSSSSCICIPCHTFVTITSALHYMQSHGQLSSKAILLTQPHDTPFNKKHGLLMFSGLNSVLRNRMWVTGNVQRLPLSLSLDRHHSFVINASALLSNWTRRECVQAEDSVVTKGYHPNLMLRLACQPTHQPEMQVRSKY
jgi:hypothetical protein